MRFILFVFLLGSSLQLSGQDLYFGIRAGLGYSKITGPVSTTQEESHTLNSGLHFGFNVGYEFNDFLSLRTEIIYNQRGTDYNYKGDGFFIFNPTSESSRFAYRDSSTINLEVSNAYLSIPLTVHLLTLERFEFHAGAYISFLLSPQAGGSWKFGSTPEVSFRQDLVYNYRNDYPGGTSQFGTTSTIGALIDEQQILVARNAGAYYFIPSALLAGESELDYIENLYRGVDYGLTGGFSYFLNKGLYLGLKGWYGLKDISNNTVDFSYENVNTDGSLIYVDDYDRNVSFELSLGFKF